MAIPASRPFQIAPQREKRRAGYRGALTLVFAAGFGLLVVLGLTTNRLPERYSMMAGNDQTMQMAPGMKMLNVTQLTGPTAGTPDRRFTLTAQKAQVKLDSGQVVEA